MAKLIDQMTGEERQFVKSVTLVGRAEYCDVCVPERIVSREHARILRKLTGFYVVDLGSTHGTRINNVRIRRRTKLHDGDVITIAAVHADPRTTSGLHPPHTDTTSGSSKTPFLDRETAGQAGVRVGASFVFRK